MPKLCLRQPPAFNESRISVSSATSSDGLAGSAGFSSSFFFSEFIARMTMKIAKATILARNVSGGRSSRRDLQQSLTIPQWAAGG